ncbi:MAG: hypothetical protein LKG27_05095 [Clostridiaceae bacterium]|jgi:hypothetical protein|nr:hypothetical protein [Clostridiaceae bacterium]
MKIDNINQSTNFGMALRINPSAQKALENAPLDTIKSLQRAGEELKDTKFCDLEIGENLTPRIDSVYANAFVPPFTLIKPLDEFLTIATKWDGTELNGLAKGSAYHASMKFENTKAALEAYNSLKDIHTNLDRAIALTKMFDNEFIRKDAIENSKKVSQENIKHMAQDLMSKFGTDTHKNEFKK